MERGNRGFKYLVVPTGVLAILQTEEIGLNDLNQFQRREVEEVNKVFINNSRKYLSNKTDLLDIHIFRKYDNVMSSFMEVNNASETMEYKTIEYSQSVLDSKTEMDNDTRVLNANVIKGLPDDTLIIVGNTNTLLNRDLFDGYYIVQILKQLVDMSANIVGRETVELNILD